MTVKSDEVKKKQYSYFSEHMKNANKRLHKKMILPLSNCKKVLLINNNSIKIKRNFTPITVGIACFIEIDTIVTPFSF